MFVSLLQATLPHVHRSCNDVLSPLLRDFFDRRSFVSASRNSLATSNASSTLLFRLAMTCDNSHLPSRLCSTARYTSSNLVVIFFARIRWVTSWTVKPLCWRDFLGLDAFFSLASSYLPTPARCPLLLLIHMRHTVVCIVMIAKMHFDRVRFVKETPWLKPCSLSCQFQSHVVMAHIHLIVIMCDSRPSMETTQCNISIPQLFQASTTASATCLLVGNLDNSAFADPANRN